MNKFDITELKEKLNKLKYFSDYLFMTCNDLDIRTKCYILNKSLNVTLHAIDNLYDLNI